MSYKTILVHVDHSRHAAERIRVAARLAAAGNAHLVGAAMTGISRYVYGDSGAELAATIIAAQVDALTERAEAALAMFDEIAASAGVQSYERRLVNDDPAGGLAQQARYADLVVLSQTDKDDPAANVISDVPEYTMLNGGRPVLIVPYAGTLSDISGHALLAWDESIEATRAVGNALPLLKRMRKVTVALFNPVEPEGRDPGADIALYLSRHGVVCEVACQQTQIGVGDSLLSMAADLGSDLLVMGGYGHTRFRELLLGGVTATVLKTMTVPVLMSH
jgi:nucleotide-binding universal stress UspA family protein